MNRKYARKRTAQGLLLFLSSTAALMGGQNAPANAAAPKPKTTEEAYKNIQILKGIPADQLIPAMQFITYSLGVECSFCHVEEALEKDDKKTKQTARKMMQMMFAINRDSFEGKREVTCNSCHRGSAHPQSTPVMTDAAMQSPPALGHEDEDENVPADVPSVEQIFGKYAEAIGGATAIGKLSSRVEKGTINLGGRQLPIEIFSKSSGRRVTVIQLPNGDNVTAYDGASGWTSAPQRPVRDIPAPEIVSARVETDLQLAIDFAKLLDNLRTRKPEKIGDRDVYVVSGFTGGEPAAKFYFDEGSGLLLRLLRYVNSPLGLNPTQIDYADYRDQGGVKIPFQRTVARPGSRFSIQMEEAHNNVPVDDAKFARPASPPSPPTPSSLQ